MSFYYVKYALNYLCNKILENIMKLLKEEFEIHETLNKKLFDEDHILRKDVRNTLMKIADMFVESMQEDQVPLKVYDYWLVGSNAAYNYTPTSDIDIHIIVDMDMGVNPYILRLLYDYIKSSFNDKYDIKVKGHEVELYLEDINTSAVTNGIYSLKQNKWIKVPTQEEPKKINIEDSQLYKDAYKKYQELKDDEIEKFIDDMYVMRKISLANDGEFGEGNLVFKEFRNKGYLDELKDRKYAYKSKELTLEKLEESQVSGQTAKKKLIYDEIKNTGGNSAIEEICAALDPELDNNFSAAIDIHHLNGDHTNDNPANEVLVNHNTHSTLQKLPYSSITELAHAYANLNLDMYGKFELDSAGNLVNSKSGYYNYNNNSEEFFLELLKSINSNKNRNQLSIFDFYNK